jgi:hypothetical protein
MNACCSGCRLPSLAARPSTVVICLPASFASGWAIAETALPSS